ncbi:YjdF family protein [Brucepastera parasyntrophica]|uniref:DUF2992 family protein n=1 Tax=Brucepastera parasyntrophica TaxID=2880008 RepID=UPI00210DBCA1|nr:DUF2992 family protein [Brucepastera parasyntrophica]ULQ60438.1 YjdF family protein [Brucepastera parasyntrophica]
MDNVVTTVFFDGQFWSALIEKESRDGTLFLGRYVFGPEPSNTDLLHFYLNIYATVPLLASCIKIREKKQKRIKEQARNTSKSRNAFRELQREYLRDSRKEKRKAGDQEREALRRINRDRNKRRRRR